MKKFNLHILLILAMTFTCLELFAMPYQLINNESALIIPHLNFEVKEDVIYSTGYIEDYGLKTQLRFGLGNVFEISCAASFNYFPEIKGPDDLYLEYYEKRGYETDEIELDNPRLSYVEPKIKFKTFEIMKHVPLIAYGKYKHSFGIPIIVPYPEDGEDKDAIAVTTPNAYQGKDITIGLVTMFRLSKSVETRPIVTAGIEGVYLWEKDWMEERRDTHVMVVGNFSPALIFLRDWMLQFENRFEYWYGRGWHYEVLPGIRYEIQSKTIFEVGVGIPIMGGAVTRYFFGFAYEFGTSNISGIRRRR